MIDTLHIYEDFVGSLGEAPARKLAATLGAMYLDLQQTVTKEDFRELKQIVAGLGEAQQRTEARVAELAEAQQRTEARVEELAEAQQRTERTMQEGFAAMREGFADVHRRFGVLGSRWGDGAEEAFRRGLLETVRGLGYTVEHYHGEDPEGFINHVPRSFDLDVLVHDGELVVAEIKSNASGADVTEFHRCVLLYERQTGRRASKQILVAVTIQGLARVRADQFGVIVATGFEALSKPGGPRPAGPDGGA